MEQKNITTGNIITGAVLIVVGIIILPLGLVAMFAYPDAVWVAGMVFTIIGGTLIFYGIRNIEIARSQEKKSATVQLQMMQQPVKSLVVDDSVESTTEAKTEADPAEVLVYWRYTDLEWSNFITWEQKDRKLDFYIQAGWVTVLGTALLMISRAASIYIAASISFSIGTLVAYLRYRFAMNAVQNQSGLPPEVRISRTAFLINGKYNPFFTDRYRPEQIRIIEDVSPKVLELRYGWGTRRGRNTEELKVPIPSDKYDEAKALLEKIKT
jgi:membrane protein implicated in regulation of membrane protease activity